MAALMVETRELKSKRAVDLVKGWHADPFGLHNLRYFDGELWTTHVTHFGPVPCHSCTVAQAA